MGEDKCNHLSKVKGKLEQSLDECEDALEREKKSKGDVEKIKRKIEGDLKLTKEAASDLERINSELSQTVQRKEKEVASIAAKIEDEQTLGAKYSKQVKELTARMDELDEEINIERNNRAKAEKNRALLSRDLEDIGTRLEQAGSNTSTQIELNKKRESELAKIKGDLEEANISHEGTLAALRQKHNNGMSELGEQIDSINKNKAKSEKDKAGMERDLAEARSGLEEVMRARSNMEKNCKMTQGLIVESNQKLDELARALNEAVSTKKKSQVESQDLTRQIEETENSIAALQKNKISLTTQLEDTKRLGDGEARDRATLLTKFKNLTTEAENLRMRIDEESDKKNDALKALSKAQSEIQLWKSKYEVEALGRIDELEGGKQKLGSRVVEAEEVIENLNAKIASSEKSKSRMEAEYEELSMEYERTHAAAMITEKRGRNFDKVVGEWKAKADDLMAELDACSSECRNFNAERFRVKAALDESSEQLDIVRRENKNLADEVKDLLDQLGDGGRSIHELDKQRRRLEVEKEELQAALEEAEGALEQEENKVLRAQLELGQVRQEIDRKIQEKEEEFDNTRKNHQKGIDGMQSALETESKGKAEALRMKKKLESDVTELEMALEHANAANADTQKTIKKYQNQIKDSQVALEEEQILRDKARENLLASERKANANQNALEEARTLLEQSDRARRMTEQELSDTNEQLSDLTCTNQAIAGAKRKLDSEMQTLHADLDEMANEASLSDDKAKKAMVDAARLADELRNEQECAQAYERDRKLYECQVKDMHGRLDEAETNALKNGKKAMNKMDTRVRELESELECENRRYADGTKNLRKSERHIKELIYSSDEDRKNQERMQALIDGLQSKIKLYKKQIEEAEEIAALNLAKYRQAHSHLAEAEERADLNEKALAKAKVQARGASAAPL